MYHILRQNVVIRFVEKKQEKTSLLVEICEVCSKTKTHMLPAQCSLKERERESGTENYK